ncbi:ribonuclease P protein component 1 [Natrialba magadii ATCC 43099]|uniref:Ribonuclease P protein component 1 n=1 Tax=Natrialba magadii (strain ATCC 43099 / DSM 3394 / CCM 3739 / CIP 104546 / IAM 13178 / JCM 8861 / NBRC 102185 / NCIMB 2190 / MS3) TaxID=547559 RepID=D3SWL8_NATMM|nr:ribonuclease P protein component 1 [Natrialba magadii]ADD03810.1 ribonuclease P protein component 1 [Natrialba magadii ATCC 43099]ELY33864.1 ribonuclease P protein component 1 [Natrialba magadii ATCC 43099]
MALTPETLPRHELNGLPVRVVESDDDAREGLEGRVVIETTNTLSIEVRRNGESRVVMVPKSGSVFEFAITDEAADSAKESGTASKLADTQPGETEQSETPDCAGEGVAYVTVDGSRLLSRPARRTETSGDSPWQ